MYKVWDDYDANMELIGSADTIGEVKELARERYNDTDGECYIVYGKDIQHVRKLTFSPNF